MYTYKHVRMYVYTITQDFLILYLSYDLIVTSILFNSFTFISNKLFTIYHHLLYCCTVQYLQFIDKLLRKHYDILNKQIVKIYNYLLFCHTSIFLFIFLIFYRYFTYILFRSETSLIEINKTKKKCHQISKRLNELISRLLPDTDIQDLQIDNIGIGVRSILNVFSFNSSENIGVDVILSLKATHDDNNNNDVNNKNNNNDDGNDDNDDSDKNIFNYDILDFETENYYKIGLLSLQNICNIGIEFTSICELLEQCNLIDAISFLRGRLIESRLHSVEVGVIGKII